MGRGLSRIQIRREVDRGSNAGRRSLLAARRRAVVAQVIVLAFGFTSLSASAAHIADECHQTFECPGDCGGGSFRSAYDCSLNCAVNLSCAPQADICALGPGSPGCLAIDICTLEISTDNGGGSSGNVSCETKICVGDPVEVQSGSLMAEPETDVVLDDPLLPLQFVRFYSQQNVRIQMAERTPTYVPTGALVGDSTAIVTPTVTRPFGSGWFHSYSEHLRIFVDPASGDPMKIVDEQPDGNEVVFHWIRGVWRPTGSVETLLPVADAVPPLPPSRRGSLVLKLNRGDGSTAYFVRESESNPIATLYSMQYNGVNIVLRYYGDGDAECPATPGVSPYGLLCKVATSSGRKLYLNYNPQSGRVTNVSAARGGPALASYSYAGSDCGSDAGDDDCNGASLCCALTDATRLERYHYDTWKALEEDPAALFGMSRLRWADLADGAVIRSYAWEAGRNRIIESDSLEAHISLAYGQDATSCQPQTVSWPAIPYQDGLGRSIASDIPAHTAPQGATQVTNWTIGGHAACRYYDTWGYPVQSDPSSKSCACDAETYNWGSWPVYTKNGGVGGELVPQDSGRHMESVLASTGRYTDYEYVDRTSGRKSMVVVNSPVADGSDSAQFDSRTTWTRFQYAGDSSLVARVFSPSVLDGDVSNVTAQHNVGSVTYDMAALPLVSATQSTGATWSIARGELGLQTTESQTSRIWAAASIENVAGGRTLARVEDTMSVQGLMQTDTTTFYPPTGGYSDGRVHTQTVPGGVVSVGDASACSQQGYDLFGNPYSTTDANGTVTCFTYDDAGRPITITNIADHSLDATTTYSSDGKLTSYTVGTPPSAMTRIFYGGGAVQKVGSDLPRGTADLPTQTLTYGFTPERRPELMTVDELVHNQNSGDAAYGNNLQVSRSLGAIALDSRGAPITCNLSGPQCSSDVECFGVGTHCVVSEGRCQANVPATSSDDPCAPIGALCREGNCRVVLSSTTYSYQDTGTVHQVSASRVYGDKDAHFPPQVQTTTTTLTPTGEVARDGTIIQNKTVTETMGGLADSPGQSITTTYDGLDRPVQVTLTSGPNGSWSTPRVLSAMKYDQDGNVTTIIDPNGRQISTVRLLDDQQRLISMTSPDSGSVYFEYDEAGDVVKKRNADGTVTASTYDTFGRLTLRSYPGSADGHTAGLTLVYDYDTDTAPSVTDCVTQAPIEWPANRFLKGRLAHVSDDSGDTWLSYDAVGRAVQRVERRYGDTCARSTVTAYGPAGQVTSLRYPSGRTVHYEYDGLDPLLSTGVWTVVRGQKVYFAQNIQYSGSRMIGYETPTGLATSNGTLLTGEPKFTAVRPDWGSGEPIVKRQVIAVDEQGNPREIEGEKLPQERSLKGQSGQADVQRFDYDDLGALTRATRPNAAKGSAPFTDVAFVVDGTLGANRTQVVQYAATADSCGDETARVSSYEYAPASNRLTAVRVSRAGGNLGATTFTYDNAGNTTGLEHQSCSETCTTDTTEVLRYNEAGQLVEWASLAPGTARVVTDEPDRVTFQYDYRDLRTLKWSYKRGVGTSFHYLDSGTLLNEVSNGGTGRDYVWLGSRLVGIVDQDHGDAASDRSYWVAAGLLDEPIRMTDQVGHVVWSGDHDPFGKRVPLGTVGLAIGLPGQYLDQETELYYNWHRYYVADLGVYLQPDPLAFISNTSYSYVAGAPLSYVDPDGADAIPIAFPDYKITVGFMSVPYLGHAAIVIVDPASGHTYYYEYGRYDPERGDASNTTGYTRQRSVPDLDMDPATGRPTPSSLKNLLRYISKHRGHGTRVKGTYIVDPNFSDMKKYADSRLKENRDPKRRGYELLAHSCVTFQQTVLQQGVKQPPEMPPIIPSPNNYMDRLRDAFKNPVDYRKGR